MKQFPFNNIHCTAFEHSTKAFSNRQNCNYLLQNEIVPLTTCSHKYNREKFLSLSNSPILIQKAKLLGCPQMTPGFPQHFISQNLSYIECSYDLQCITFKQTNKSLKWRALLDYLGTFSMLGILMRYSQIQKAQENKC